MAYSIRIIRMKQLDRQEFYKEPESGIYFLKTLFKQKKN